MKHEEGHLSDQELLLAADGELSARDAARVQAHLAACWSCRARRQEIEGAIGEFVRLYRRELSAQFPSADGPRALLKAQLAQLTETNRGGLHQWLDISSWRFSRVTVAALCGLGLIGILLFYTWIRPAEHVIAVAVPDPSLTPGATVLVSRGEVCRASNTKNKTVPVSLRRQVFDEYGIKAAEPAAYEVDYLITPALGGADDIHNLWPESYTATVWNAQVKDALEDHLRDLVCGGQLDLETAQHEIAMNWIDAYKKYFHTDRPLTTYR